MVAIEWHINSSYPQYSAEARAKWRQYPPPYNGGYATPWLWVDGHNASYVYYYWESYISNAMTVPADIGINLTGSYDPGTLTGQVSAEFINSADSSITANAYFVVTEDSVYYLGGNGDAWHNHVCRDYIPDENGTSMTIPAGGSDTLTQNFELQNTWNASRCNIVVYLQNPVVQPDSSKPVYQGAIIPVPQLIGIKEMKTELTASSLQVGPNPCHGLLEVKLIPGTRNNLQLRDITGRIVREVKTSASDELIRLNMKELSNGIYFISLANNPTAKHKIVLNK